MRKMFIVVLMLACGAAHAQSISSLVGLWESPDGNARQQFIDEFPGLLATKMWFKVGGEWTLVGQGVLYSRPGEAAWVGVTRTSNMGGIELFESVVTPLQDGRFSVQNHSYDAQGAVTRTAEDWTVAAGGTFDYTVYKLSDGERTPWMEGRWIKLAGVPD